MANLYETMVEASKGLHDEEMKLLIENLANRISDENLRSLQRTIGLTVARRLLFVETKTEAESKNRSARNLTPGDTIKFSDRVSPKYLKGLPVTFEKRNPKRIVISCPDDPAYGRFRNSKHVTCPVELLDLS